MHIIEYNYTLFNHFRTSDLFQFIFTQNSVIKKLIIIKITNKKSNFLASNLL